MINITDKPIVRRYAKASGSILLKNESITAIKDGTVKKGDVFASAKIAGLEGAKEAWNRMPFCHQIPIESVDFDMKITGNDLRVSCSVVAHWKTGVEMDALSCVSSALLTVWDMVKYIEKDSTGNYPGTLIKDIRVDTKEKAHA